MRHVIRGAWLVAAVLLGSAGVLFGWHRYEWSMLNKADGVVMSDSARGPSPLKRRVAFFASTGEPLTLEASDLDAAAGDSVLVLYDPRQPQDARVWTFGSAWRTTLLLAGLGVTFAGAAYALHRRDTSVLAGAQRS